METSDLLRAALVSVIIFSSSLSDRLMWSRFLRMFLEMIETFLFYDSQVAFISFVFAAPIPSYTQFGKGNLYVAYSHDASTSLVYRFFLLVLSINPFFECTYIYKKIY